MNTTKKIAALNWISADTESQKMLTELWEVKKGAVVRWSAIEQLYLQIELTKIELKLAEDVRCVVVVVKENEWKQCTNDEEEDEKKS